MRIATLLMNATACDASDRRARRLAWPLSIGLTALVAAPYAFWSFRPACLAAALLSALLGLGLAVVLQPAESDASPRIGLRAALGSYAALVGFLAGLSLGVFFHLPLGRAFLAFLGISLGGALLFFLLSIPLAIVSFRQLNDPVDS